MLARPTVGWAAPGAGGWCYLTCGGAGPWPTALVVPAGQRARSPRWMAGVTRPGGGFRERMTMSYQDALARVIDEVIAPGAAHVDRAGEFPGRQVAALGGAGLLRLTIPAEFGGGGEGLRAATHVTRELGAACGSTAMIVTMHYAAV